MKKTILAIALMAVTGMASAQVTLSGKVGQYFDRAEVGSVTSTKSVTEPTSNFAVTAKENLGKFSARAVVETSLVGNTFGCSETRLGDRQMTVGLVSQMGSIDIGRNVHSHFLAIADNDAFGTLYGSVAGDVHNVRNLRISDAVFFTLTPHPNVSLAAERTQPSQGDATNVLAGAVKLGPVTATAARFDQGKETSTVLGVRGKMASTNVMYTYSDNQGLVNSKGHLVGASQRFGDVTAKASWGKTNLDVTAWAVGADLHLSKRTDLTVSYKSVNQADLVNDTNSVILGLIHKF